MYKSNERILKMKTNIADHLIEDIGSCKFLYICLVEALMLRHQVD